MINSNCIGIYLAGGQSRRMESNKLMLPLNDIPLGSHAIFAALHSGVHKLVIVTKKDDSLNWLPPRLKESPYKEKLIYVPCNESPKGQSYSLKCGVKKAIQLSATSILILLADQPFITYRTIDQLITNANDKYDFVAARYKGILKPPILFSKNMFEALLQLEGDEGARRLVRSQKYIGKEVEVKDGLSLMDIDTMEDYLLAVKSNLFD